MQFGGEASTIPPGGVTSVIFLVGVVSDNDPGGMFTGLPPGGTGLTWLPFDGGPTVLSAG